VFNTDIITVFGTDTIMHEFNGLAFFQITSSLYAMVSHKVEFYILFYLVSILTSYRYFFSLRA